MRSKWVDALEPLDLSPFQLRSLRVIANSNGVRPGQVAQELGIAPRSATEAIEQLSDKGLVDRKPDPSDRRAALVSVTHAGAEKAAEAAKACAKHAEQFFGDLDDRQQVALEFLLGKLVAEPA